MGHPVKCLYCGKTFDRDKEPWVKVTSKRYAHKACSMTQEELLSEEEKDKQELEKYIMKLFKINFINPLMKKQIKSYIKDYGYSYSGIQKSLQYFYEIKNNSIEKANGGIGIVPYVYDKAYKYYYALWEAQQKNENKDINLFVPKVKEVVIPVPKVKIKKRNLFAFLDEEYKSNAQ